VRVSIANTHAVQKSGLFGRAILTYTLALGVVLSDQELAAIAHKNIYNRVIYEPPWHPHWRIPEDDEPPAFLVYHLVQIHEAQSLAAIAYFDNDHDSAIGEGKLRKGLEELKEILTLTRRPYDEFDL
jgi:hypothetical protein